MAGQRLEGKSVVLVVPPTQFREEEVFEPKRLLEREGARVVVASTAVRTCRGMRDGTIESQAAISDIDPAAHDALVLAGGSSVPGLFWKDKGLVALAGQMAEAGKILAAISLSTVVLANAKLLEGRGATVYRLPAALDALREAGATFVNEKVVVDGNLIMAEGPSEADSFAEAIAAALSS